MARFFLPQDHWPTSQSALVLDEAESHHALQVMRLEIGQRITVFDGQGREATVEITPSEKKHYLYGKILMEGRSQRLSSKITLAQAIPKKKNMDLIIQKATELGASEIVPVLSDRVVTRLETASETESKQRKWQTVAIEAAKQCGQNWLPKIDVPQDLSAFFQSRGPHAFDLMLIASLQNDAKHLRHWLDDFRQTHAVLPHSVLVLIGPEGDFTPAELASARSFGCKPITLGPIILRTETAALYCLSVLSYELLTKL